MSRRVASLLVFLGAVFFVTFKGMGLALFYYVFVPALVFPILLFLQISPRFLGAGAAVLISSYLFFVVYHPSLETGFLGAGIFSPITKIYSTLFF